MKRKHIVFFVLTSLIVLGASAQRYNRNAIKRADTREQLRLGITAGLNLNDLTSSEGLDIWNGLAYYDMAGNYIGLTDTKPFKVGFNIGVTAQGHFGGQWFYQGSLLFTTKGYKLETQNLEVKANAGYMQIPVEIMYKFPAKKANLIVSAGLFAGVGVCGFTQFEDHYGEESSPRLNHPGRPDPIITDVEENTNLIGCDITVHGANDYWADKDDTFASDGTWVFDGGFLLGVGVEWWRFQFMLRYQYSLTPFYDYGHDFSKQYQRIGQDYKNSFDYFGIDGLKSPHNQSISFSISYFFDNVQHGIRL